MMPRASSSSISPSSTSGSTTQPAPRTHDLAGEDPRRELAELERLAADDDRVPGVRAALVAADDVRLLRKQVDDLALALVAPLRADDDGRRHDLESARTRPRARRLGRWFARSTRISWPRTHVTAVCSRSSSSRPSTWAPR